MIILKYDEYNPYNLKFQENIIYEYLKDLYSTQTQKKNQNYIFFDNEIYVFIPIEYLKVFNLTPFKQREILKKLEDLGLIKCRFGQSKARYFKIVPLELQNKREQIMNRLKKLDKDDLDKILQICESEEE